MSGAPDSTAGAAEEGRPGGLGVKAALLLLRAYKILLSPLFAGSCRFTPSCSDYMAEAVARHGVLRGGWLGVVRLSRCRPFGGHGVDLVPEESFGRRASRSGKLTASGSRP